MEINLGHSAITKEIYLDNAATTRVMDSVCQKMVEVMTKDFGNPSALHMKEGIDILTFETFSDMEHILPAIRRIKKDRDLFVMVQFSVNQFGYSNAGLSAGKLIAEAAAVDAVDAVGFNCGVVPDTWSR